MGQVPKLESDWSQGWWCVECEASAKDVCKDEHLVLRHTENERVMITTKPFVHKAAQQRRDEENQALRTPARKSASCDSHRQSSVSRESSRLSMNMDRLTLTALRDICETCKEPIHGAITHAKDKHFHPDHFVCAYCYKKLGSYFFKDSKFYCEDDYHNLFSPRCASCRVPIRDKVTTALQKTWHPEHFCCFHCQQPFDGASFYTENNKPYCRKDFSNLFAPKCHGCKRPIMERYTTCQGKNWHNECFKERT